jgi:hypothetical protein
MRNFEWLPIGELDAWAEFWDDLVKYYLFGIADSFYSAAIDNCGPDAKRCLEKAAELQALGGEEHQAEADRLRREARWLRRERKRLLKYAHKFNRLRKIAKGNADEFAFAAEVRRSEAEEDGKLQGGRAD